MTTRRTFLLKVVPAVAAVTVLGSNAIAAECSAASNTVAKALNYVPDTKTVDQKKFPKHTNTQTCSNCLQLDTDGTCKMMKACGKVADNGWCQSWVQDPKKPKA